LHEEEGGKWFIKRDIDRLLAKDPEIDTLLLGCTHYPLVASIVKESVPAHVKVVTQGEIVANSLKVYLEKHKALEAKCSKNGMVHYLTTETSTDFDKKASAFVGEEIHSTHVVLI
jgi:glutamate racemase